jgi:hypothetical protein
VLEQHPRIARNHLRRLATLLEIHGTVVVDQPLRRAQNQRERCAQLVADIGEELRLDLVELADALEQALQLDVLLGDLQLLRLLRGDIASLGTDEHDLTLVIHDRAQRRVDDDRLFAAGTAVDCRVPADELTLRRARDRRSQGRVDLLRDLPPEGRPKRLALDIGELDSHGIERDFVDLEDRALGIQKPDELNHRVQRDARELLQAEAGRIGENDLSPPYHESTLGVTGYPVRQSWTCCPCCQSLRGHPGTRCAALEIEIGLSDLARRHGGDVQHSTFSPLRTHQRRGIESCQSRPLTGRSGRAWRRARPDRLRRELPCSC